MAVAKPSSKYNLHQILDERDRTGTLLAKEVATNPVAKDQFCEEVRLLLGSGVWVLAEQPTFEPGQFNHSSLTHTLATASGRTFLSFAVKFGLCDYVASKTNRGALAPRAAIYTDKCINRGFKPGVRHTVWPLLLDAVLAVDVEPAMVRILLAASAGPNFKVDRNPNHTPWIKAVEWAIFRYWGYFHGQTSRKGVWPSYEEEVRGVTPTTGRSLENIRGSIYDAAWSQTDWVQRSWAALYEGEWSSAGDTVYRKPDPDFLRKPPCKPVIRDMIDHGVGLWPMSRKGRGSWLRLGS